MKNGFFTAASVLALGWLATIARADLIAVHSHSVTRYSESSGAFLGETDADAEELLAPVVAGPDLHLYAPGSDLGAATIVRFYDGARLGSVKLVPRYADKFTMSFGLCVGANGNLYYGANAFSQSATSGEIREFDRQSGLYVRTVISSDSGLLRSPTGLAVGPEGDLYVSDGTRGVWRYSTNGVGVLVATNSVYAPHFAPDGGLYANDDWNGARVVQRFDATTGAFVPFINVANFGISNVVVGAFGPDGMYYMADRIRYEGGSRIHRYDPKSGGYLGVFALAQSKEDSGEVRGLMFSGAHLSISAAAGGPVVRFPKLFSALTLERANGLDSSANWSPLTNGLISAGFELVLTNSHSESQAFFRLRR